jgi:hypothetical protein
MLLTSENYHSQEANRDYLSVSQYKDFVGVPGIIGCEERAMAKLKGDWEEEESTALLVGLYVDAYFEGTLNQFTALHPQIFMKNGELKSDYRKANDIINRIERDEYFLKHLKGDNQVIMTGLIEGVPVKIKIDSFFPDKLIVDLKTVKSISDTNYVKGIGHMDFIRFWGYDIQGAVYQEIVYQVTGKKLPFKIAAASKEKFPDLRVFQLEQELMDEKLEEFRQFAPAIQAVKNGDVDPTRCEDNRIYACDYCKHTRVLKSSMWSNTIMGS